MDMNPTTQKSYRWLFWTFALLGLLVDQGSKYGVFGSLYDQAEKNPQKFGFYQVVETHYDFIVSGELDFKLWAQFTDTIETGDDLMATLRTINGPRLPHVNRGALFGFGSQAKEGEGANSIFLWISLIAAIAIALWSFRQTTAHDRWLCITLGLILAGTLGNLYDRVVFAGVRDFLYLQKPIDWPVFNIADVFLVCGAGLLLIQAFFTEPVPPAEMKQEADAEEKETATAVAEANQTA